MACGIAEEFAKQRNALEESGYSEEQSKSLIDSCLNAAQHMAVKLPEWFNIAERTQYNDVEGMTDALPDILAAWENAEGVRPAATVILTPDAVLARIVRDYFGRRLDNPFGDVAVIYIKPDGDALDGISVNCAVILSPAQWQTPQIERVTNRLAPDSLILLLDPDCTGDLPASIRKNDVERLEYFAALWEIEPIPDAKRRRLNEFLTHFQAML